MLFLYKRPGQRVILNAAGHMMVRPTHLEASVQKSVGGTAFSALHQRKLHFIIFLTGLDCLQLSQNQANFTGRC
jgi:1,4-dihydroxy-2-naphthoate octaprenyltransferase